MGKSLVYTRAGDDGTTSLVGGKRVPKTHPRLHAYGTVDELNATIGLLLAYMEKGDDYDFLLGVQHRLFSIGAYLATEQCDGNPLPCMPDVAQLEEAIDRIDSQLPPLHAFVLPGGAKGAAVCHLCRTVCRRAERRIQALEDTLSYELDEQVKCFINRLSDYLFVLSRKLNNITEESEIYWDKRCE